MPNNEVLLFIAFNIFILAMLAIDLGVFIGRRTLFPSRKRQPGALSGWCWLCCSMRGILWYAGPKTALEFFTGYIIERSLSFDNIFVFVLVFSYFGIPAHYQHKALFWGIIGALITRSLFIATGTALISHFEWVLYIFGAILIFSGWKMMFKKESEVHPDKNLFIRLARKIFPVHTGFDSGAFMVRRDGTWYITSMLLVLITVETTDIVFAVDSIPAVFGVTRDPFIVYSSNIFAILGLRATYFLLAGIMDTFYYLSHGLSLVLIFIGVKMVGADLFPISIGMSLLIVTLILAVAVVASVVRKRRMSATRNGRTIPSPEIRNGTKSRRQAGRQNPEMDRIRDGGHLACTRHAGDRQLREGGRRAAPQGSRPAGDGSGARQRR